MIEGVRGSSDNSFIGIDDLRFNDCEYAKPNQICTLNQFQCSSQHCVSMSSICDLGLDCCDGSDESINQCSSYYRFFFFY